ncbi:hypothetical protein [Nocardia alni]|uniref:hypothetical protein n=1 Tax=Nocardia alni TaxID=2815723 RepID=UPI001C245232|nr:hypothetical protein [Nocardia alni]
MADETKNGESGDDELDLPDLGRSPEPMLAWERGLAIIVGLAAGVPGVFAVFMSGNQAGTAVLLIAAIAFLLIGVQSTPLIKLASGNNSLELGQRQRIAKEILKKVESTNNPAEKGAYAEAAVIAVPELEQNNAVRSLRYEKAVSDVILTLSRQPMVSPQ